MTATLYERIYTVARLVPSGQVATYGHIAMVVGAATTARQVGEAMAALRGHQVEPPVPWQRIINAQGKVSTGPHQQHLLEAEGVIFDALGCTNLQRFGWRGPDPSWAQAHGMQGLPNLEVKPDSQLKLF